MYVKFDVHNHPWYRWHDTILQMGKSDIWEAFAFFLGHTLSCARIMLELSSLGLQDREEWLGKKKVCPQIFPSIHQFRNDLLIRTLFLWDRSMWLFIDLASPNVTETQGVTQHLSRLPSLPTCGAESWCFLTLRGLLFPVARVLLARFSVGRGVKTLRAS